MAQGLGSREIVGQVTDTSSVSSGVVTVQFRDRTDTEVKAEDLNPVQESKLLAKYKPGECFGELALLCNTRRTWTAHATEDGERSGGRVAQRDHCVHCAVFLLTSTLAHQCTCLSTRHIHCLVCRLGDTVLCVRSSTEGRKGKDGKGRERKGKEWEGRERMGQTIGKKRQGKERQGKGRKGKERKGKGRKEGMSITVRKNWR